MESNKQSDSSNLLNENQNNSNSIFNRIECKNTPFSVFESIGETRTFCVIALGNSRVSENIFDNVEEALQYIETKPWELILNTMVVLMEKLNNVEQLKKVIENENKNESEA